MRILNIHSALVSLIFACSISLAAAQSVTVPAGTSVSVELMQNVHSSFDTQGEVIRLQVTDPVRIQGVTVFAEGARVEAEVASVESTGMVGKAGGINFHPVRIEAVDGQWVPLDPTNFGDEGEGAGAGAIFAIGLFAKGRPGFVPRGTDYRVTIRRDTEVAIDSPATERERERERRVGEVTLIGSVASVRRIRTKRNKPDGPISLELDIPPELTSFLPTGAADVAIVSFNGFTPDQAVESSTVAFDSRDTILTATFDWWSVVKYAQPETNVLVAEFRLSDGRLAQANLTMQTEWQID